MSDYIRNTVRMATCLASLVEMVLLMGVSYMLAPDMTFVSWPVISAAEMAVVCYLYTL